MPSDSTDTPIQTLSSQGNLGARSVQPLGSLRQDLKGNAMAFAASSEDVVNVRLGTISMKGIRHQIHERSSTVVATLAVSSSAAGRRIRLKGVREILQESLRNPLGVATVATEAGRFVTIIVGFHVASVVHSIPGLFCHG